MAKFNVTNKTAATKALEKLLNKEKTQEAYDPSEQAKGLRDRIEGSGLDADKFTDQRNFVEKALNLTPNQNFLFDVFEIINRPQQAVFQAIEASQEDRSVSEALWSGFSGEKMIGFKEILHNTGVEETPDKVGMDDVLGFVGDVFLDPVDLALIAAAPFSGGATAAVAYTNNTRDAAKAAEKTLDAARAMKAGVEVAQASGKLSKADALNQLKKASKLIAREEKALKAVKATLPYLDELEKAAKTVTSLGEGASKVDIKMAKKAYKEALKPLMVKKSPIEMAFRGSKYAVKTSFKTVDNNITAALGKLDAHKLDYADEVVSAQETLRQVKYKGYKEQLRGLFKTAKVLPKNLVTSIGGKATRAEQTMLIRGEDVLKTIKNVQAKTGESFDKVDDTIQRMIEFKLNTKTSIGEIIHRPNIPIDVKSRDEVIRFFNTYMVDPVSGAPYKTSDELAAMFEQTSLGDGVIGYYFKGDPDDIDNVVADLIKKESDEYAEVQAQIDNIYKKVEQATKVDETTYDIVRLEDGSYALNWTKASQINRDNALLYIDSDIIAKHSDELGIIETDQTLRAAADEQLIRSKMALMNAQSQLNKTAKTDQVAKIQEEVSLLKNKVKRMDALSKSIDRAISSKTSQLEAKLNPSKFTEKEIARLQEPYRDKFLDAAMDKEIPGSRFWSADEKVALTKLWEDPVYKDAATRVGDQIEGMHKDLDDLLGTNFLSRYEEGYVRHAITPEAEEAMRMFKTELDGTPLKGRTASFRNREYEMSAVEANRVFQEKIKRLIELTDDPNKVARLQKYKNTKLFETELSKSVADFIVESKNVGKASLLFDEVALNEIFINTSFVTPAKGGVAAKTTQTTMSKEALIKKLEGLGEYRADSTILEEVIGQLEATGAKSFHIDNNLMDLLGIATSTDTANVFLAGVSSINNIFKKLSLATPGFHVRNFVGNLANIFLSGVPMNKFNPYMEESVRIITKGKSVMEQATLKGIDGLSASDRVIYEAYTEFMEKGFHDIAYELYDLPGLARKGLEGASQKEGAISWVLRKNMDGNKYMDNMYRMALYRYAKDNPQSFTRLGLEAPEDLVRRVLFDPNDLTKGEKMWLRNIIPFYTFMKKNLAYQMVNVFDNPVKYNQVVKAVKSAWSAFDIDQDQIEAYKKENFWIPVMKKENGEYIAIKANLPIGDLGEFVSDPLQKIISSVTPGVRAPFEWTTNTQTYTGLPIQQFEGQRGFKLPFLTRKQEYALGQFGVTNPAAVIYGLANSSIQREQSAENIFNAIGVTSTGSLAREESNRAFQELEQLRGAIQYYKQEGAEIKTLDELREQQSLSQTYTNQILNRLRSNIK